MNDAGATPSVERAATRGVAWISAAQMVNQVLAFAVFILLGRLLSPAQFGLVAAATVVIYFLRLIVNAGLGGAVVQRAVLTDEHVNTAFWVSMTIALALALATVAAAPLIALLFGEPRLTPIVRALSFVFVLAALETTQSALVDRALEFRIQALRRAGASLVSSCVAVGLALAGAGVWALVGQALSYELLVVGLLWSLASWRPVWQFSSAHLRELLTFGGNFLGVRVMIYLSQNVDNFLVGAVLGPTALGLYVVAYRVLLIMIEVLTLTINQVSLATFSRYQQDQDRLHGAFYRSVDLGVTIGWPAFIGVAILSDQLIPFLFGQKWLASAPVMTALALGGFVQVATTFTQNLVIAIGEVKNEFRWNVLATTLEIAVFVVTAQIDILAVAIGLSTTLALLWPLRIWRVTQLTGIRPGIYIRILRGPALATGIMACGVLVLKMHVHGLPVGLALAVEIVTGALVYLAALHFLAPTSFDGLVRSLRVAAGARG